MSVFDNLGTLIEEAQGAVDDFESKVSALEPLLGDDRETGENITLDEYIRLIIEAYLAEGENSEDSSGNPKLGAKGKPLQNIDPLEQVQADIRSLQKKVNTVDNLQVQNARIDKAMTALSVNVSSDINMLNNNFSTLKDAFTGLRNRVDHMTGAKGADNPAFQSKKRTTADSFSD